MVYDPCKGDFAALYGAADDPDKHAGGKMTSGGKITVNQFLAIG